MKQILESERTFQAYAAIDSGYWRIEQIKLEMEKPVLPINRMIDAATGFDKKQRSDWTAEAIECIESIIENKKIIEADCSRDEEFLEKLRGKL